MTFWELAYQHPFATFFFICAIGWAVSSIIYAMRGIVNE